MEIESTMAVYVYHPNLPIGIFVCASIAKKYGLKDGDKISSDQEYMNILGDNAEHMIAVLSLNIAMNEEFDAI